jgi:hypothetical protein
MDAAKVKAFRDTINEYREILLTNAKPRREEKVELFSRFDETWYEPLCFTYNLMAPFDKPHYIQSQYQQARAVPEGVFFLYLSLGYGIWIDRSKLMYAIANAEDEE